MNFQLLLDIPCAVLHGHLLLLCWVCKGLIRHGLLKITLILKFLNSCSHTELHCSPQLLQGTVIFNSVSHTSRFCSLLSILSTKIWPQMQPSWVHPEDNTSHSIFPEVAGAAKSSFINNSFHGFMATNGSKLSASHMSLMSHNCVAPAHRTEYYRKCYLLLTKPRGTERGSSPLKESQPGLTFLKRWREPGSDSAVPFPLFPCLQLLTPLSYTTD